MPQINPNLPSDGDDASVAAYNPAIIALLALVNGQIDGDNIAPGSLPWSVMANFTNEIPVGSLQDNANIQLFRQEADINFVAEGIVWSPSTGLGASMTEGVVYASDGTRVEVDAVNDNQFDASKDTYIDIAPNGTVTYTPVNNNAAAPAIGTGYLRVAIAVTNGSTVTAVHSLAKRSPGNEIGRFTAGAATDTLSVQNIPKKKHIRIRAILLASGELNSYARLNNDSGATNYDYGQINNGSGYTSVSSNQIEIENGAANGTTYVEFNFYNILNRWKTGQMDSVVNDAPPKSRQNFFSWKNTTQDFNRIDIMNAGSGDFAAGSEIIVYGDD